MPTNSPIVFPHGPLGRGRPYCYAKPSSQLPPPTLPPATASEGLNLPALTVSLSPPPPSAGLCQHPPPALSCQPFCQHPTHLRTAWQASSSHPLPHTHFPCIGWVGLLPTSSLSRPQWGSGSPTGSLAAPQRGSGSPTSCFLGALPQGGRCQPHRIPHPPPLDSASPTGSLTRTSVGSGSPTRSFALSPSGAVAAPQTTSAPQLGSSSPTASSPTFGGGKCERLLRLLPQWGSANPRLLRLLPQVPAPQVPSPSRWGSASLAPPRCGSGSPQRHSRPLPQWAVPAPQAPSSLRWGSVSLPSRYLPSMGQCQLPRLLHPFQWGSVSPTGSLPIGGAVSAPQAPSPSMVGVGGQPLSPTSSSQARLAQGPPHTSQPPSSQWGCCTKGGEKEGERGRRRRHFTPTPI